MRVMYAAVRCVAAAALLLALTASRAMAWGQDGHEIVGRIAEDRLTPEVKQKVNKILDGKSIADYGIANGPDLMLRLGRRPETAKWHYVNIPVSPDNVAAQFDEARDGHGGDCAVDQITRYAELLRTTDDPKKQAEAVMFLTHLVGDLHQPLHCAKRPYGSADNDRGGNAITVLLPAAGDGRELPPEKLHAVWDSAIVKRMLQASNLSPNAYADTLNRQITPDNATAWLKPASPVEWANEGVKIAAAVCYQDVPIAPPANGSPVRLSQLYVSRAEPVINLQLQKAGVRLAQVLNRALAGPPSTVPSR